MYEVDYRAVSVKLVVRGAITTEQLEAVRQLLFTRDPEVNVYASMAVVERTAEGLSVFADLHPGIGVMELEDAIIRRLHAVGAQV